MEIVLEFVMEIYMEIATMIVPEEKIKPIYANLLKVCCVFVSTAVFILLFVGISFIIEGNERLSNGIIITSVGGALLLLHIILFGVVIIKNRK